MPCALPDSQIPANHCAALPSLIACLLAALADPPVAGVDVCPYGDRQVGVGDPEAPGQGCETREEDPSDI